MSRLQERVAIITGGAGGIGRAIARLFLSEGARVMLVDLDGAAAADTARQLADVGPADVRICDVGRDDQVAEVCEEVCSHWGRLDVVVNNAGVMTFKPIGELTESDWLKVLQVDLLGAAFFMKHAFARMKPGGSIVNISSIHAVETSKGAAPYAAAKAALLSLTRTGAIEAHSLGIRVNAVVPGAIDTPMLWSNPNVKSGAERLDRADVGQPADLAAAILFLASSDAAFVNGASLVVDGGRLARL